jgi:hypothetical protein
MQALMTHLLAGLLLLHAAFGCCWHRVHACADAPTAELGQHSCRHDHQCQNHVCLHSDAGQSLTHSTLPCKCELGCQGVCTYLPTPKAALESLPSESPLYAVSPGSNGCALALVGAALRQLATTAVATAPPLRLHLLNQLLLI